MEEDIGPKVNDVRAQELVETGASRIATACPFCYIMMDDGVKAAGKEEDEVKVADLAIHLVEALEAGEDDEEASRKVLLENPNVATPDSIPADDLIKPLPAGDPVSWCSRKLLLKLEDVRARQSFQIAQSNLLKVVLEAPPLARNLKIQASPIIFHLLGASTRIAPTSE